MKTRLLAAALATSALLFPASAWANGISLGASPGFGSYYDAANARHCSWVGPNITFSESNDSGWIGQYKIDGLDWAPIVGTVQYTLLGAFPSVHDIGMRYVDAQGNDTTGTSASYVHWALDNVGPKTRAVNAIRVQPLSKATFRYRVSDSGSAKDYVRIVIRNRSGKKVKSFSLVLQPINKRLACTRKISLPKGRYRWQVIARDNTGNKQVQIGWNTLRVL